MTSANKVGQKRGGYSQLPLDLPSRELLDEESYLVSSSNQQVFRLVTEPDLWRKPISIIVGGEGAGKTHLGEIFANRVGAIMLDRHSVDLVKPAMVASSNGWVVEDVDQGVIHERAMIHLINQCFEHNTKLLLTARTAPSVWPVKTPDLKSRLRLAQIATIATPDAALLSALLVKLFTDRQIEVTPDLIEFLVQRMERTFRAASNIVDILDHASLVQKRAVNKRLAQHLFRSFISHDRAEEIAEHQLSLF